jgi:hypothetical protein
MPTLTCPACNAINSSEASECTNCGSSLATAKLEHAINEIKKTTEKMRELTTPRKTFYSINGCGTTLLDYRALADGTYAATRWVTVFGLPLVPLAGYVIEPTSQEYRHGGETSKFTILEKTSLALNSVIRTYLLAVIGVMPLLLGAMNSRWVNHTLGGPLAFLAMIACFAWLVYIIFYRLKNDGKAYKTKPSSAAKV